MTATNAERFHIAAALILAWDARRPKRLLYPERLPADRDQPLVFYCGGPT